jgi:hypothetical protein
LPSKVKKETEEEKKKRKRDDIDGRQIDGVK